MIVSEKLTRRYGDLVAVDSVNFTIQAGEIVGLLGHNGAGKTTIMKMMTGYLEPSAGGVSFDGVPMHSEHALENSTLKQKLGYLAENLPLYPEMNVIDYLDYTAQLHGVGEPDRPSAVRKAIEETDLHDKAFELISTLSRGYRQRVGVAQAVLHAPAYLIMDEPTNGLDPSQTAHMRELIRRLSRTSTIVLSTHIMQEVNALCDRVLILREGRLVLDEALQAIKHSARLLLNTNADLSEVNKVLCEISELSSAVNLNTTDDANEIALPLQGAGDIQSVAADVAKCLVANNIPIYSLVPEQRDLEALFQQAGQSATDQEMSHVG